MCHCLIVVDTWLVGWHVMTRPMRYLEDLVIGEAEWGIEELAVEDEMIAYAVRYDPWPFHVDTEAARQSPFGGLTASSGYSLGLCYSSANRGIWNRPDSPVALIAGLEMRLQYLNPLRPGDRVRSRVVVTSKRPSSKPGRGVAEGTLELINQDGDTIIDAEAVWLVATRP
jgi:acyl dehydratase